MKITLWGTRGSVATPGFDTAVYGGNTACVEVRGEDGTVVVLDAGTGIRALGKTLLDERRIHVLLTHLHMDHIQGLGFFAPLFVPDIEVHIWGPSSTTESLRTRLTRYLGPPLFPVVLRDVAKLHLHEVRRREEFRVGCFTVTSDYVCHPNGAVGYRIVEDGHALTYLPDHEPYLGVEVDTWSGEWTSGFDLARETDLLIHDAQYTGDEYGQHIGWGHSRIDDAMRFATISGAKRLVPFHHDPGHDDRELEKLLGSASRVDGLPFELIPGREGLSLQLS